VHKAQAPMEPPRDGGCIFDVIPTKGLPCADTS
jgi:hypothetical protein